MNLCEKCGVYYVEASADNEIDPLYTGRMNLIDVESVDAADTKNMKIKIDRASQVAYETALQVHREELRSFCNSRGANFVTVCTDQPIEKVLFKELLKVGIMA